MLKSTVILQLPYLDFTVLGFVEYAFPDRVSVLPEKLESGLEGGGRARLLPLVLPFL